MPAEARAALLAPPDDYGLSRDQLISQFPSLPEEQQLEILGKKWDLVRGPEMIAALQPVIGRVEPGSLPKSAMALRIWGAQEGIGKAALRRLKELSPDEAYRIWAKDITRGTYRKPMASLPAGWLPMSSGLCP